MIAIEANYRDQGEIWTKVWKRVQLFPHSFSGSLEVHTARHLSLPTTVFSVGWVGVGGSAFHSCNDSIKYSILLPHVSLLTYTHTTTNQRSYPLIHNHQNIGQALTYVSLLDVGCIGWF